MIRHLVRQLLGSVPPAVDADFSRRNLMLQALTAANTIGRQPELRHLSDAGFKVFSQWGEDGIIEWLVNRLPDIPQSFIEFGATNYQEANTRFLLEHRNWRGLIAEADEAEIAKIEQNLLWRHDLTVAQSFITRDNINDLFQSNGFTGDIGLLSIDIDGNDYWVWAAISVVSPAIVVCEYNAVFGDLHPISVPYDPAFVRSSAHSSYLYWGTSIGALVHVASKKGYSLVGSNREGNNAFFVRNDLAPEVTQALDSTAPLASRYRESRDQSGRLSHVRGTKRADLISDMPVSLVTDLSQVPLGGLGALYSRAWLSHMG
jgi:hypothetical protein